MSAKRNGAAVGSGPAKRGFVRTGWSPENSFGGYAGTLACDGERIYAAGFDDNLIALPAK